MFSFFFPYVDVNSENSNMCVSFEMSLHSVKMLVVVLEEGLELNGIYIKKKNNGK